MMNEGTAIRDGQESHMWREQGLSPSEPSAKGTSVRARPGILIFSRARQLLHMNSRALELTCRFDQAETGLATMMLSRLVSELRVQIQDTLDNRRQADISELVELKRDMVESGRKILVRGFGIADRNSHEDSRIVIVLEEIDHRQEHKTQPTLVFSSQSFCVVP